jgi:hypothetical protein
MVATVDPGTDSPNNESSTFGQLAAPASTRHDYVDRIVMTYVDRVVELPAASASPAHAPGCGPDGRRDGRTARITPVECLQRDDEAIHLFVGQTSLGVDQRVLVRRHVTLDDLVDRICGLAVVAIPRREVELLAPALQRTTPTPSPTHRTRRHRHGQSPGNQR